MNFCGTEQNSASDINFKWLNAYVIRGPRKRKKREGENEREERNGKR